VPQAVTVRVQKEEDGFMAVFDELNLHGFGSSVSEAVERLAEATVEYWLHLRDDADMRAVPPCREHYRFLRDQLLPAVSRYSRQMGRAEDPLDPAVIAMFAYRSPSLWQSHLSTARPMLQPA